MRTGFKTNAEGTVVFWWRIGGVGMIVLSSLGILFSVLMLLVALFGPEGGRSAGVFEAVGAGVASGLFMYVGIRLASATRRDLHDV